MVVPLYDELGQDYDRFVNWDARMAFELPFLLRQFERNQVRRVLDMACATGRHAIAFQQSGYQVEAADPSVAMIQQARENATRAGAKVPFHVFGFGQIAENTTGRFDAITCLGNSLPHALSEDELRATLRDMAEALTPGGVLVLQLRNFQRVLQERERFMSPQVHRSGEHERVFLRFYDYDLGDERLRFNMVRLQRRGSGAWQASVDHTWLRPWRCRELQPALERVGLRPTQIYGNLGGEPFEAATSSDLVIVAQCS